MLSSFWLSIRCICSAQVASKVIFARDPQPLTRPSYHTVELTRHSLPR
ncbi:hypothetical protein [Actomonas aquatica]|uniref:Uncharacterized protein n=1 Tax=Actomonas aquatica TaxID=2866162 RepID=A0ABZ1C392_9BACT|nr:hypothetical protein [Opitutus sp. WL0086]WRQ86171.1 hypothetical protein K1X11_015255 [Opitutus sp. WL0086]